jgi:hypothetical protein
MTNDEKSTDDMNKRMVQYDERLKRVFDAQSDDLSRSLIEVHPSRVIDPEDESSEFFDEFTRVIDDSRLKHVDDDNPHKIEFTSDPYVGMELSMSRGAEGELVHATVRKRVRDDEGKPVGSVHANPLLDSRKYEVHNVDGNVEELTANLIAENLIAQVDEEDRRQMMLSAIANYRVLRDAISQSQGTYVNYGGKRRKTTTRGWELLVAWRNGSSDWVKLKDLKDSYPVELAMYATPHNLEDKPAFAWWVPYTLRKQKRILQKVKSKYWA